MQEGLGARVARCWLCLQGARQAQDISLLCCLMQVESALRVTWVRRDECSSGAVEASLADATEFKWEENIPEPSQKDAYMARLRKEVRHLAAFVPRASSIASITKPAQAFVTHVRGHCNNHTTAPSFNARLGGAYTLFLAYTLSLSCSGCILAWNMVPNPAFAGHMSVWLWACKSAVAQG